MKRTKQRKKSARNQPAKPPARTWPYQAVESGFKQMVYRRPTPAGNPAFMLPKYVEGKRCFECFHVEQEAVDRAHALARLKAAQAAQALTLTNNDAKDFVSARSALAEHNLAVSVPKAAMDYAAACESLRAFPAITVKDACAKAAEWLGKVKTIEAIDDALGFYAKQIVHLQPKLVADAVQEFIEFKEQKLKLSDAYIGTLHSYLDRFAKAHACNLSNVTDATVRQWLDGLNLKSAIGFNTARAILSSFFTWAEAKPRCYAIAEVMETIEALPAQSRKITIYTAQEMERLLLAATQEEPEFVPRLALGGFAGLRSTEIDRLHWSQVRPKFIHVEAEGAKTGMRRLVPVSDNLAAWLAPHIKKTGMVWQPRRDSYDGYYRGYQRVAAATEVPGNKRKGIAHVPALKWLKNALRHSFISYRVAQTQNVNQVALESGNSAQIIFQHYRELVSVEDAQAWFSITPQALAAENVTPLRAVAAGA